MDITNYKCNFDAVMKSSVTQLWTKLQQKGSFLLVLSFLFTSTAQLFHIHIEGHVHENAAYEENEQIQVPNKCTICDYYHHIQGQQILLYYPTVLPVIRPEIITLNTRVLKGNYEFTLQVIANKGPPSSY